MRTYFNLTVRKVKNEKQHKEISTAINNEGLHGYAFWDEYYDEKTHESFFSNYDSVNWFEHSKDMVMLAEQFPNAYFELSCQGEDSETFWKEYYHDMDVEVCHGEIVYEQPKKVQWTELVPF